MSYLFITDLIADYLCFVLAFYFLICAIDKKNRYTSLIISFSSFIALITFPEFIYDADYKQQYIDDIEISIEFDGVTALIIIALLCKERIAVKQASLLGFAVLCHTMILYDLTVTSSALTNFFYEFYDEMIIIVSILQMVVARDGVFTAIRRAQGFVYGFWFRRLHSIKNLRLQARAEKER